MRTRLLRRAVLGTACLTAGAIATGAGTASAAPRDYSQATSYSTSTTYTEHGDGWGFGDDCPGLYGHGYFGGGLLGWLL